MGEEWGCRQPFLFFCDFPGALGEAVRKGRREEFKRFKGFTGEVPDPLAESTFQASVLDWAKADHVWLAHYQHLLSLRQQRSRLQRKQFACWHRNEFWLERQNYVGT